MQYTYIQCHEINTMRIKNWIPNVGKIHHLGIFFFRGGVCRPFRKMVNIFAYTCPNRSGVGAINNPDRSEQVFDAYYISEVSKKIFMDDISMVRP